MQRVYNVTCLTHSRLLDLVILITFYGEYYSWNSSYNSLQPLVIFTLLDPNIHLSILI
jgi:hypothetical protein